MNVKSFAKRVVEKLGYRLVVIDPTGGFGSNGFDEWTHPILSATKPYTLTSYDRLHALCQAVKHVSDNNIAGSFVECGVWKGGSALAAALAFQTHEDMQREMYLYDTYEGMTAPTAADIDYRGLNAEDQLQTQAKDDPNSIWCAVELDAVKQTMALSNYPAEQVHYVVGKVEETIPATIPEKISILRLDTDWYESTLHEMEHLFPRLVPGGVLILDDYGFWQGARQAVDEYLARNELNLLLHRIDATGRMAVKPAA